MLGKITGYLVAEFEFTVGEPFSFPCTLEDNPDWLTVIDDDQGVSVCIYVTNESALIDPETTNRRVFSAKEAYGVSELDHLTPYTMVHPIFNHGADEMGHKAKVMITKSMTDSNSLLFSVDSVPCAVITLPVTDSEKPEVTSLIGMTDQGLDYTRALSPFLKGATPPRLQ